MMVYDRMRLNKKARDLLLPQPQEAVYFGTAKEDMGKYCATVKERYVVKFKNIVDQCFHSI